MKKPGSNQGRAVGTRFDDAAAGFMQAKIRGSLSEVRAALLADGSGSSLPSAV